MMHVRTLDDRIDSLQWALHGLGLPVVPRDKQLSVIGNI